MQVWHIQDKSHISSAVARVIQVGGTQVPEVRAARGVWGHAPPKIWESGGLEMLFPAFSKSYL